MDVVRTLPRTAEKLSLRAQQGRLTVLDLQSKCPWLCQQIVRDADTSGLFDLWTECSNYDELAGVSIVEPGVLQAIGNLARLPLSGTTVHAGLQHTYGYLLSTIVTRFGYKRDRWLSPMLEAGFGLPTDVLGPIPSQGTLLSNATLFAGKMAFRGQAPAIRRLKKIASAAADAVQELDVGRFEQHRIVETVSLRDSRGRFRSIRIQTDLVPFPNDVAGCTEDTLLVYSIDDSSRGGTRLTTLFPIAPPFLSELMNRDRFGSRVEIRTRFNAYVEGWSGQTLSGRRTIESLPGSKRRRKST